MSVITNTNIDSLKANAIIHVNRYVGVSFQKDNVAYIIIAETHDGFIVRSSLGDEFDMTAVEVISELFKMALRELLT